MSIEFITGTEFINKDGEEHRVDVTPDWQVWADQERRLDNLDALSAVMVAGYVANLNSILDSKTMYKNSFDYYRCLAEDGSAEKIVELERDIETRLGSVFSQPFRKIYLPAKSILNKNILQISVLNPRFLLLLTKDMTDNDSIVETIRKSKIAENERTNNSVLQDRILENLLSRRFIKTDRTPNLQEKVTPVAEPKYIPEHKVEKPYDVKNEFQKEFTHYSEYQRDMLDHIKTVGYEPFDIDDLVNWAKDNGFNPNRGEVERIVLLEASRKGLVKRTNVYKTNSQVKEMWKLI